MSDGDKPAKRPLAGSRPRTLLVVIGIVVGLIVIAAGLAARRGLVDGSIAKMRARTTMRLALRDAASGRDPVPPTTIGINPTSPRLAYSFANMALATNWQLLEPHRKNSKYPADYLDPMGELKFIPAGASAFRPLQASAIGTTLSIRCTYDGKGKVTAIGRDGALRSAAPNVVELSWRPTTQRGGRAFGLGISDIDPADPIRHIDCRPIQTDRTLRFDPAFVAWMARFKVLRFMGWENVNQNPTVTWASRHTTTTFDVNNADGVAVEDMVALAIATKTSPWFTMPWNADDDYIERFARYVHATLPAATPVYVELSNEVWNTQFKVSRQAAAEGMARGLSANHREAMLFRYAERLAQVMDIWSRVFADHPSRLVRVISTQHANAYNSALLLAYRDTPRHIDALATAPYFGYPNKDDPHASLDTIIAHVAERGEAVIATASRQKAIARRYGKRYIAYEAGQGVILKDVALAEQVQRDPRMYDLTKKYIAAWRSHIGDTLMMFGTVFKINKYGAWGLREYEGQPASEAPKLRAVDDALRLAEAPPRR